MVRKKVVNVHRTFFHVDVADLTGVELGTAQTRAVTTFVLLYTPNLATYRSEVNQGDLIVTAVLSTPISDACCILV